MRRQIATSLVMPLRPADLWAALSDFSAYPAWNRFIVRLHGAPIVGSSIRFCFALPSWARLPACARILVVSPDVELRWAGNFLHPRLFRAEHYFVIEAGDEGHCTFQHGEHFSGLLLPLVWPLLRIWGPPVYTQMNHDLLRHCQPASRT